MVEPLFYFFPTGFFS